MSRFDVLRRIFLALALVPFVAGGVAAAAGPKPGAPKTAPPASAPKIQAMTAAKMALIAPATKEFKAATARAGGFEIDPGDLKTPVRVTVRQPWADAYTSLAFVRPTAVMPRGGDGIASMGPSLPPAVPSIDLLGFMRGEFTSSTPTDGSLSAMGVVFRASAGRKYVVTCTFEGEGAFGASIIEASNAPDATSEVAGARTGNGHVGTLVLDAPRMRDLTVQFTSTAAWTSSACEITPVG